MASGSLNDYVEAISQARSLVQAASQLVAIGKAAGLDRPAVVADFTADRVEIGFQDELLNQVFGWLPAQAQEWSGAPLNRVCPVARACRVATNPFIWEAANIGAAEITWDQNAQAFWRTAAERGIYGGVTVPVHMPQSRVGAVGWLALGRVVDLNGIIRTHANMLRLAAYLFMDHVYRERAIGQTRQPDASLSERELECLTWVALGKTDAEIGELISRSPSTARFHVERAVEKLGVNNRTRAAAVACQLGIISAVA
jgi:DNA-binding CsgD family transcriptional regulator